MGNKFTLQDCIDLATFAHRHQYDKAGEPYINHPLRVMRGVQAQGAQGYVQMAAVLHDVTEDTPFTPQMLLDLGVPEAAVEIVRLVDRGHSARDYVRQHRPTVDPRNALSTIRREILDEFYYAGIKTNAGAVQVKLADIGDNLQPWRLAYLPPATQDRLRAKYAKAIDQLTS